MAPTLGPGRSLRPSTRLPDLPADTGAIVTWVQTHLGHLCDDVVRPSSFRGGQAAADAALAGLDIEGYASRRSTVLPVEQRGASRLSPYIRHGLLDLPTVWEAVASAGARDRSRYRDELLWQEYARHLYARIGTAMRRPLRYAAPMTNREWPDDPWPTSMACVEVTTDELYNDGWLVNQTRMWLSSQYAVRAGRNWRDGEDEMFRHLLDGSRAANRLGWQWTVGMGTGKVYGFSRWQVEKRAAGLCDRCTLRNNCPIERWPDATTGSPVEQPPGLSGGTTEAGPFEPVMDGEPEVVWLTAESLGTDDPALRAHRNLPSVFVFDEALLARLRLSGKRLVFLAETLAEAGAEVHLGDPVEVLAGRRLATTYTYVPGWKRRSEQLDVVALHPWPWLRRPSGGSLRSFSAWSR